MPVAFDPYSNTHKLDPYARYRELREHAPVHRVEASSCFVLSRYDDVQWALNHPELFSSKIDRRRRTRQRIGLVDGLRIMLRFAVGMRVMPRTLIRARMLILEDGAVHSVMRKIVNRGFTPRHIADWEPRIREIAAECAVALRGEAPFDLVQALAIPLPVTVIAEILGVPPEDRLRFKQWSDAVVAGGTGPTTGAMLPTGVIDAMVALRRYLRPIVAERRRAPADDLISVLVDAQSGEAALNDFEIFYFLLLLMIAGNETTTNLIGNAVDALFEHPRELERLAADPSLIPTAVEEALRYDSPVQFVERTALADVELHGVTIPKGELAVLLLGSANRDERRFADPDRFCLDRDTRGHLGFGYGAHFCLGASLARLEARAALDTLVPELPRLARVTPTREFLESVQLRGRVRLELEAA